ncbi:MAG: metal-dependent hydrolase [Candidatus Abawacabacteria bacterium]|nr:metal-dependent hydrolase [Candidatus Abawacabacteria bacterium]
MMFPTHVVTTAATTAYFLNRWNVSNNKWLFALGFVAGALPDFDLLYYMLFKKRKNTIFTADAVNHRQTFMHAPLFYLAILIPLLLISLLTGSVLLYQVVVLVSIGVFSHIIMDMVWVGGVPLLWPFDISMRGFFLKHSRRQLAQYVKKQGNDWMAFYLHHPLFYCEMAFLTIMMVGNFVPASLVIGSSAFFGIPALAVKLKQRKLKRQFVEAM